ncbi:hypothetical protein Pyrfu_0525 [Pyrolobus fumarii 1A]|uniref:Uncharacterized protein n=1 Tax=Pyrolobus fumarii (strain DSM 11204 / 1A) TaxID=694429 RepID=G0EGM2_PYRF1|nr:hypothetical protein [Pyrolobus fumarii]AEM38396.1 hypothetical protein Pyrfu_0525 [Pyrolobus fumarii 1A]
MRRSTGILAALSSALVAAATLLQMYIDWNQMPRSAQLDLRLKLAVAAAGLLTLAALILGLLAASKRR